MSFSVVFSLVPCALGQSPLLPSHVGWEKPGRSATHLFLHPLLPNGRTRKIWQALADFIWQHFGKTPPPDPWGRTERSLEPTALHSSWLPGRARPERKQTCLEFQKCTPVSGPPPPKPLGTQRLGLGKQAQTSPLPKTGWNSCPYPSLA